MGVLDTSAREKSVVIVGAGVAGLVAALLLSARGARVTVLERAASPGGKLRQVFPGGVPPAGVPSDGVPSDGVPSGGAAVDAGPTVFTLRAVWDEIFAEAGAAMPFALTPLPVLARHAWGADRLDLFADTARSAEAIGAFAGAAEARGYRAFCARARAIWDTLEAPYIRADHPTPLSLAAGAGVSAMFRIAPFQTLWRALGEHFADPRLRQLFGRYATYSGSSPFQCPATLMLIAHVEQSGVWSVVGGMHGIAAGLARLATERGAIVRLGVEATGIVARSGAVAGVRLADGETVAADAVLFNGDVAALAGGLLGEPARRAVAAPGARSLSAVTWAIRAETEGFPLLRHNVFFGDDYPGEFDDVFRHGRPPRAPTVYVCAQDRDTGEPDPAAPRGGPERLLCLINAPANGASPEPEMRRCETAMRTLLARAGLTIRPGDQLRTGPAEWAELFPATGGALYGPAQHGWRASFSRPPARARMPGLYLAGGSAHPGPGLPMAALSGRFAARAILADLASTSRSRPAAMSGGMSTR